VDLNRIGAALVFAAALLVVVGAWAGISELLANMPAPNTAETDAASAELIRLGPSAIREVCAMLVPPGAGDDAKAQFLLSGVAKYVMRPGAETERKLVAGAFIEALKAAAEKEVKAFLLSQLQLAGREESVGPLAAYLNDDRLCEPAVQALLAIRTPGVEPALLNALPGARGANRVTLIKALGEIRGKAAVKSLLADAQSGDRNVRQAALFALSEIGDPAAAGVLVNAAETLSGFDCGQATSFYLRFAERLAETGKKKACVKICRRMLESRKEPNVQCAALSTLIAVEGKRGLGDLLAAMRSDSRELRGCALQLAARIPGKQATAEWVKAMTMASPQVRAEIVHVLGSRGDKSALPAVLDAVKDPDKTRRLTAIDAAARLGGADAVPVLLATIRPAVDADEIKAIKDALLRLPTDEVTAAVAQAVPGAQPAARKALIEALSARRATQYAEVVFAQVKDADESVRVAAVEALENLGAEKDLQRLIDLLLTAQTDVERTAARKVVVAVANQITEPEKRADLLLTAMGTATGEGKARLIQALAGIGGKRALETVVAETKTADPALQEAALRALAEWPDAGAAPELLNLARGTKDLTRQVVALRGYVRLVGAADFPPGDKVRMYKDAMVVAQRPDEIKLILGALGDVRTIESLACVGKYLDDKSVQAEAALAAVKIACPQNENDRGLVGPKVALLLKKAAPCIADEGMRKKVEAHIAAMPVPDAEGFISLFNGKDLTGWTGDTNGYVAENGEMICRPGGNLYTENEYGDFVIRFEFKLTAGANNGLGIRAPLAGDAAYEGMEIQILDDSADQYKDLHPYQYHGSIYGVVPAERGHLKPVGEWNFEEVTAKGRRITVKLNGAAIVDADIDKASAPRAVDGKNHPGLKRDKGHIGFLGHGTVVEFRNIRIKELD
jgi:HEAT repeat protein